MTRLAVDPADLADLVDLADPGRYRAGVEQVLAERLAALAAEWSDLGDGSTDQVLGEHDAPRLLADLVTRGGKRLRPLLAHWGWVATGAAERGDDPEPVRSIGAALELLHAFGLAQDDVMDESLLRRGGPAVHVVAAERHRAVGGHDDAGRFGESVAVLVGDLAHLEADALVAGLSAPVRALWRRTGVELVRGQVRDLSSASRPEGTGALARAREVAHAKSGAYSVQRPLQLGAAAGGGSPRLQQVLGRYGALVGEAFALRDDLLGVFGDPTVTGKPGGDDLRSAKATVLLAMLERRAGGATAAAVARLRTHRHDEADVDVVRRAMVELGVRAEVEVRIEAAFAEASRVLDPAVVRPDAVRGLGVVAGEIAWRAA